MEKIPGFDFSKVDEDEFWHLLNQTYYKNTTPEQKRLLDMITRPEPNEIPKFLVDATHRFWVKYGKMFGVKVETNFSNFANVPVK